MTNADKIAELQQRAERVDLILRVLENEGLVFQDDMTREERDNMDVERQAFVLRLDLNTWPMDKLRQAAGRQAGS